MQVHRIGPGTALCVALLLSGPVAAEPEIAATERWAVGDFTVGSIDVGGQDLTVVGLTLGGGYMFGDSIGVGARLPLAHARTSGDSGTALSNLTADVFWVLLRRQDEAGWSGRAWFRGSYSAPTASDADIGDVPASAAYTGFWLPDPGLYHPDAMTFRGGAGLYATRGRLFVDSHADVQLVLVGGGVEDITNMVLRLGGGYRLSDRVSGFGSFSNAWRGNAPDTEDKFLHWFDLGLSLAGQRRGQLRAFLYVPIDSNARDLGIVGFGISVASGL